jgi:hypothetical protein
MSAGSTFIFVHFPPGQVIASSSSPRAGQRVLPGGHAERDNAVEYPGRREHLVWRCDEGCHRRVRAGQVRIVKASREGALVISHRWSSVRYGVPAMSATVSCT